jgi:hypothetical protein
MPKKSNSIKQKIANENIIAQEKKNNNNFLLYVVIAIFVLAIFLFILYQIYLAQKKPNSKTTELTDSKTTELTDSKTTELTDSKTTELTDSENIELTDLENIELTDLENIEPKILCQPGYKIDNSVCIKDTSIILDKQDTPINCNVQNGFIKNGNSCICNVQKGFIKDGNSCKCIEGKYKDKSECKNRNGVWIYEDKKYKGKKKFLPKGDYKYVQLNGKYNTISSIIIQGKIKLKLYEFSEYKGAMKEINTSISDLSTINFLNKISSIKMYLY